MYVNILLARIFFTPKTPWWDSCNCKMAIVGKLLYVVYVSFSFLNFISIPPIPFYWVTTNHNFIWLLSVDLSSVRLTVGLVINIIFSEGLWKEMMKWNSIFVRMLGILVWPNEESALNHNEKQMALYFSITLK